MDTLIKTALWRQFGASIDYLADTVNACPDELWLSTLWNDPNGKPIYSQFWYRVYHTLYWLDLYLTGDRASFAPPPQFSVKRVDGAPVFERPFTKAELQTYLAHCRHKCQTTLEALTDADAERRFRYDWGEASFFELLIYNLRHVEEHAAQLGLFLGQRTNASGPDYVVQVRDEIA
jgi:DinB superfamily